MLPQTLKAHQVLAWHDSKFDLDYTRYQQWTTTAPPNPQPIQVSGAQVTVVSRNDIQLIVAGAYFPNLPAVQPPAISAARALSLAADLRNGLMDLPAAIRAFATRRATLRIDPDTGRLFYLVATSAPGNNGYQQIDAQTGELIGAWGGVDQISAGQGTGVKNDTKTLSDPKPFPDLPNLTSGTTGNFRLRSVDNNFVTYDAGNGSAISTNPEMTDSDNIWTGANQAAGVDAQYYAALTVQFYRTEFGFDWLTQCSQYNGVRSVVHYGSGYDNAFWDEQKFYMVYGDGSTFLPLSAGQDVVSHELTHGVTQCRADLTYRSQSGALNESISDIMATAAEFAMEEPNSSNCWRATGQTECGDWLIGEDLAKTASGAAIRDLAHPQAEGQPSHFADRSFQGTPPTSCFSNTDYCDVHHNSGIPNHAFYLLANGGRNARCSGPTDPKADCDVMVPSAILDHAMQLFFHGFAVLSGDATMCDARNATIAHAQVLYPGSVTDMAATILAWQAVGLGQNCDQSSDFKISLSGPTVALAPGGSGSTQLSLVRLGGNTDQVDYTVDKVGPMTPSASPNSNPGTDSSGSQIGLTADNDATDGVYPILVTATGAGTPHYAAAVMVIDAEPPSAAVSGVGFVAQRQVSAGGSIPLSITWAATDGQSGIASAELDHSPNGSAWVLVPGGTVSPTEASYGQGPHQFQVVATDGVGNDATSPALIRTLSEYQETSAVYTGKWLTATSATPWGQTKYSTRRRATATLTFTGTDVVWIAQRGPKRGVANVFVDGVKTHVDLYSATTLSERMVVFIASNLSAGQHTIKIKVKGTYRRPRVDVDGLFVLAP
ncbi:MAG: M4 family metallopeptidase [Chloroflexota bacterium]